MGGAVGKFLGWVATLPGPQQLVVAVLFVVVSSYVMGTLLKPKLPSFQGGGYRLNIRDTLRAKAIIYGRTRIGGVIGYMEATGRADRINSRGDARFLHRIILLAGHEIDSIEKIYASGKEIVDGNEGTARNGKLFVRGYTGTETQQAVPELVRTSPLWTAAHRLRGLAYIYVRMEHSRDDFPNGPPLITALVKGKKVFNPVSGETEWSNNPAWCIRDYLLSHPELGITEDQIDEDRFRQAATDCEREGYEFNGFFLADSSPREALEHLRTSMAGWYWYARGRHAIKAGVYTEPEIDLTQDDLRSEVRITTDIPTRDKITTIRGTFAGEETAWQQASFPEVSDPNYVEQDGRESVLDLPLPFTSDPTQCQKIARIMLNRARQQISLSASFSLKAADIHVTDTVTLSLDRMGWDRKTFEVQDWSLGLHPQNGLVVKMTLTETSAAVFEWSDSQARDFRRDNTNLPDAFQSTVPTIDASYTVDNTHEQFLGTLLVDVNYPANFIGQADSVEVQVQVDGVWRNLGSTAEGRFAYAGIQDGRYNIRARVRNIYGVWGAYAHRIDFEVVLREDLPPDVEDFVGQLQGDTLNLSWSASEDPGLSHYQLRYSTDLNGTVASSTVLERKISRPATSWSVPARKGSYYLKAVDKAGGRSVNAAVWRVKEDFSDRFKEVGLYDGVTDNWRGAPTT